MDFVWFFVKGPSFYNRAGIFNELEYSIRSVKQNVKDARCFVVGDKPDTTQNVIHIPHKREDEDHSSREKQNYDISRKFRAVYDDDRIDCEFVMMYDDIFILHPLSIEDFKINWARKEVTNIDEYLKDPIRTGTITYKRLWRSTYEPIKMIRDMKGRKTYDWETHTPRYFEKWKMGEVLKLDFRSDPKMFQGVYDGLYANNTQIITPDVQADLWTANKGVDWDAEFSKTYMNIFDNAIVAEFIDRMEQKFGKCS